MTKTLPLFEEGTLIPRPDGPGLKLWSTVREHWLHHLNPKCKEKNRLVKCGVWWHAQYDNGTECVDAKPFEAMTQALEYAKERVK